ncbi:TPA: hypothetical protein ACGGCQ_003523 [Vibrio cholerae]|uniref:Uncharacterized protein n=1 Tax=Vibrio paracholerae TaxID=650003 RepID=A0AAX1QPQ5_9VIBR|nr:MULTISPECIES: hypothetical protein [Vibrio]EGR1112954.1 hypothetical protein [Vibrio cholerae]EGR4218187.1 hypothetical protein [Vibrio cholerae]EGR4253336.1 hypothetical protein [Vibrio cholerae]ELJ8608953.1 hypothetical protein [Vibrio cholerae]MDV2311981.1 hypothetical protein [Vibrio cholerae]
MIPTFNRVSTPLVQDKQVVNSHLDDQKISIAKVFHDTSRASEVKKHSSLISKLKSSKQGFKEESKQVVHDRCVSSKAETGRYDQIMQACSETFGKWDSQMIQSGLRQHFLSYAASLLDVSFERLAAMSDDMAKSVRCAEKPIRRELVTWLYAGGVSSADETWSHQANKSHLENGLRNSVDGLPQNAKQSFADRKRQREDDYKSLTHVANKLLDEFNSTASNPVRTSDSKVLTSSSVSRMISDLVAKHVYK